MKHIADSTFTELLEAAPDAMVCVDAQGVIALVNNQAERLFGYGRDELIGAQVEVLVPEAAQQLHPAHRVAYLSNPSSRPMGAGLDLAARRKDGTTFPAEISLSAIHADDGLLITVAVRDVTERRRAAETASRLAAIVQSSPVAVIGKTTDLVVTSWNPAAERLYGYTSGEMIGRHISMIIPAEDRERELGLLASVASGGRVAGYRTRRLRKDGTQVTVSLTLSAITGSSGQITGISAISQDLTAQQRADARFSGLLEAAPDAIVCVDAQGVIALVNNQAERLFGYGRDELIGAHVEVLVPEAAQQLHPAHRVAYLTDPSSRPMGAGLDLAARRKDGTTFPAEISLSAVDAGDGLLITAAVRDITERLETQAEREQLIAQAERTRIEVQLDQSRRLESLGQLAGGVAHDFNNLLAVISGWALVILEELDEQPVSECLEPVRVQLGEIELASRRAAELTHQLLAFARREIVKPRVLNLNDVVDGLQQLLIRSLGEHIELRTDLATDVRPVLMDPAQIEQVLVNLAVNARDAMPTGGQLSIRTANVTIDKQVYSAWGHAAPGEYVELVVTDTGTGIPGDIIDRVCEPFFTTKAEGTGTGLGLATAYGVISQAGGYLTIDSKPGNGTSVSALLPPASQAPETGASGLPPAPRGKGETVLLVEDEDAVREVTKQILTRGGYHVLTAASGPEAIRIVQDQNPRIDLLLTDVVLRQMAGGEIADRARRIQPDVRIVFMSGYAPGMLTNQGVAESGIHLVEKPFDKTSLLSALHEALS